MKVHDKYSSLSPIYSGGLTNHLPMMTSALKYLDVSEEDIELIAKEYVDERGIFDLNEDIVKSDFDEEYIKITNFYLHEIEKHSLEEIMKKFLNKHRFGLQSGLFHGMIRLAYAYMEDNVLLVAQALSYFELIVQDGKLVGEGIKSEEMDEKLEHLIAFRRKGVLFESPGTTNKYKAILNEDFVRNNLFYPLDILKNKEAILKLFLAQYNKTNDFYILHVITGFHALHVLSQFFIEEVQVYRNFFMQGLLFVLLNDHNEYVENQDTGEFYELVKLVPTLRDAHEIKLFFSLVFLYDKYQLEELKITANRLFQK